MTIFIFIYFLRKTVNHCIVDCLPGMPDEIGIEDNMTDEIDTEDSMQETKRERSKSPINQRKRNRKSKPSISSMKSKSPIAHKLAKHGREYTRFMMLTDTAYNPEGVLADFSAQGLTWAKNAEAGKTVESMCILFFWVILLFMKIYWLFGYLQRMLQIV